MSPCPSRPELQCFVTGDLDSTDAETIELHIDHCDLCTEILKSLPRTFHLDGVPGGKMWSTRSPAFQHP